MKSRILLVGLGLWASGLLIGANLVGYLPGEPAWPSGLLLVIGGLVGLANARVLYRIAGKLGA